MRYNNCLTCADSRADRLYRRRGIPGEPDDDHRTRASRQGSVRSATGRHAARHPEGGGLGPAGHGPGHAAGAPGGVGPGRRGQPGTRLGQGQEHHHGLSPGRAQPPRPLGPQGERPGQRQEPVQADRDEGPGHPGDRGPAPAGADHRQVHLRPLDELHAQRPVQPHGGDLPDDDGLHDRQGQPVRPARAAQPQGLPQLRLADHPPAAAGRPDAAVRDAPAAVAGEQRRRQGRHGRASWARRSTRIRSSPTATTWTSPRWTGSRSTT